MKKVRRTAPGPRAAFITLLVSIAACTPADKSGHLSEAVAAHLNLTAEEAVPAFSSANTDLNGDGIGESIVLISDTDYCGSGGCTLLVFSGTDSGLQFISKSLVSKAPIRVSGYRSHGWKNLIVHTGGVGDVVLQFDGQVYPFNPSMQDLVSPEEEDTSMVIIGTR